MTTVPQAFIPYRQFIIVKYVEVPGSPGKYEKLPVDYRNKMVSNPLNPEIWTTYDIAVATVKALGVGYGIGFVFTPDDPFFFIDIDNCSDTTTWNELARSIMNRFPICAMEISKSGRGIHIFGTYSEDFKHRCKNVEHGIELYTQDRFVALTGNGMRGDAAKVSPEVMSEFVNQYFKPQEISPNQSGGIVGELGDEEVIRLALTAAPSAASAFGNKASFKDLWCDNTEVLSKCWPTSGRADGLPYDASSADSALAWHLAFWTQHNPEQMQRLMWQSSLVRPHRWNESYMTRTVSGACQSNPQMYKPKPPVATVAVEKSTVGPVDKSGHQFLDVELQKKLFKGCTYITDAHRVVVPRFGLLNSERFNVVFGGYSFVISADNGKVTKKAWDAFTESQVVSFPRVNSTCFRPDLPEGEIIEQEGKKFVNTWHLIPVRKIKGDVSRFLRHLEKLQPNKDDREKLLCYLAALVQHQGIKFPWCVFIQGCEGNGKTLLSQCVEAAIGRDYCHRPKSSDITARFNGWMYGKTLICVEDFHKASSVSQSDIMEILKPMITASHLEIEEKGIDKITQRVCANFIINSNSKDALSVNKDSRRFAVFFTAQQSLEDLKSCGMDDQYFVDMYHWLEKEDGFAMVAEFLSTYAINPLYNPAVGAVRAVTTTSTVDAFSYSRSSTHDHIGEAIESGAVGFRGGWISSTQLGNYFTAMGIRSTPRVFKQEIERMGYVTHPHLLQGRATRVVTPDGNKPTLYLKVGHKCIEMKDPAAICEAYSKDQTY